MCGITGYIDYDSILTKKDLTKMTDVLYHRGPDDSNYLVKESNFARVGLGHRRLSIIDLSESGRQPMRYKNLYIVFNGEVYNYLELKRELRSQGYSFQSNSDTEVILKSFHAWGTSCVDKFIGMFAFTIYDSEKEEMYLFRDRAGVKPLYIYQTSNLFLFSSELKSFHEITTFKKELSIDAVQVFFQLGYIPEPLSIFKNCSKLESGHYLKISLIDKTYKKVKYWDVLEAYNKPILDLSPSEVKKEITSIIISSTNYRSIADVPIGVFLSGGYDSTAVASILSRTKKKLKTFTIGFEDQNYNEALHARKISKILNTEHYEWICSKKDAQNIIPEIPFFYDEPFGDSSAIPTMLLSKQASSEVKVALSADAGDEVFGGYPRYSIFKSHYDKIHNVPNYLRSAAGKLVSSFPRSIFPYNKGRLLDMYEIGLSNPKKPLLFYKQFLQILKKTDLQRILSNKISSAHHGYVPDINMEHPDIINQCLAIDYKIFLKDCLMVKVDRASMAYSLEAREPLLDHRIVEFMARIPSSLKTKSGSELKSVLKSIVHDDIEKNIMQRPKKGFSLPIIHWLQNDLKDLLLAEITKTNLEKHGLFNVNYIIQKRNEFVNNINQSNNYGDTSFWWLLLNFQLWIKKWL